LLDGRAIFQRRAIPSIQVGPLSDAITTVLLDNASGSALSRKILRRKITEQLKQDADGKPVPIPSASAVNRLIGLIEKRLKLQGTPKQRQKRALNPNTPYGHHRATRPGHTVMIDATSFDIFVYDPHTKRWIRVVLLLAVDVYTRSIVAWRFVPVDAKALDAALLLFDVIRPKPALPGWPDEGLWRYFGVPEDIWIMSEEDDEIDTAGKGKADGARALGKKRTVAGIPFVNTRVFTIDHGKIFVSRTFRHVCAMHDISIQLARVRRPTDKSIIESMFGYISENFAATLPGFKGADLSKRGVDIEAQAYLFIEELDARFAEWVAVHWQNFRSSALHLPGAPKLNLTPNEMYAAGLHIGGFPRTPTNLTYFDCLDTEFHAVTSNGIYARHLYYDSHDLEPYRNTPSTVTLPARKGKYRIKVDPRDRSTIYFYDELKSNWISIPWRGAAVFPHPFGDLALGYAKALAQRQLLGTKPTDEDLTAASAARTDETKPSPSSPPATACATARRKTMRPSRPRQQTMSRAKTRTPRCRIRCAAQSSALTRQ
jgi:transposase InsO family protein